MSVRAVPARQVAPPDEPRVPVSAPTRLSAAEARAVRRAVEEVISATSWVLGGQVEALEAEMADLVGVGHAVGVANGTDALTLGLLALGVSDGARVLVPADDGGYAATAARLAGCEPVAYDTTDHGPDPESLSTAVDARTAALVVTHLHGNLVDLGEVDRWRRRHGLVLVEDCAQATGLAGAGVTGEAAAYSFYPTKNLGAVGDGGMVLLRSEAAARRARTLRQYGWEERFRVGLPGGRNSRLDELQAAVLRARLPHLARRNASRVGIAERYAEVVPLLSRPGHTVHHHAVTLVEDRDRFVAVLTAHGVDTAVHYPWLVTEMPGLAMAAASTPLAAARRARKVSLPCFPELEPAEVDLVVRALEAAA